MMDNNPIIKPEWVPSAYTGKGATNNPPAHVKTAPPVIRQLTDKPVRKGSRGK